MERVMSVEEKIKRAEEIYNRRKENPNKTMTTKVSVNKNNSIKLFKKVFIQIVACFVIYCVFYLVKNNNYVFSEDMINNVKEILSYDVDFSNMYSSCINKLRDYSIIPAENNNEYIENNTEEKIEENNIGGAEKNDEESSQNIDNLSQMEQDALEIKESIKFINPAEGIITSTFGWRNPTTKSVPKYHTGIDIARVIGTKITASMEGDVELVSSEGDYGNHVKITNGEVSTLYAHCSKIYVKEGDHIIQGQEIAEVGATGNVTGPHLHFEIRRNNQYVDPDLILQF